MEESKPGFGLFFISLSLLFFAAVLTFLSWQQYQKIEPVFPDGAMVADIPVAGLLPDQAVERVRQVYGLPADLSYQGNVIRMEIPNSIDYENLRRDLETQLDTVLSQNSFIRFLSGKNSSLPVSAEIPFNELPDSIRTYLSDEIVPRYDIPAISSQPNESGFTAGHPGRAIDIEASLPLIDLARRSK